MRYATTFAVALVIALPVAAHHSDAGLDMESVIAFEGTVAEFIWRNPHVYVTVETTDERGESIEWTVQLSGLNGLSRRGWTRESLATGDRIRVRAHPAQDGRPYAVWQTIERVDGVALDTAAAAQDVTASTSTLAGRWTANASELASYPGGFDGFFRAQLVLTDKGKAAEAEYEPLSDENPESTCIGRPTPAALVSSSLYLLEIQIDDDDETITIRSENFDEERTIYMDGRGHPENGERFTTGHSTGRWVGDVLVVDTTNFADHRSPYQIGVPSGAQKHVVERYRLVKNGTRIALEFVLEDPEYIAEPLTHRRELIYSPHMTMFRFNCDPEAASRFVRE